MNKRGIAPLLATVLLIFLATGIGVVVMNVGRAQIEEAAQCAVDVQLKIVALNEKEQICFDRQNNQIFFIAETGPQIDIDGLRMRVIGQDAILVQGIEESRIERSGTLLKYVQYDLNRYGEIRQVRLIPVITLYEEEITCPEQALILEDIRDCET